MSKNKKDGFDCITFHKLFGLGICQKVENYRKLYKIDDYKCIVFDDVYMQDIEKLQKIHRFIIENEDKYKMLATGDIKQLESFSTYGFNNVYHLKTYIINIIDLLFPNQVILKTIKRIDNEEDKIKLISLKYDLFNTSLPVMDIF